jgi:dihydroorotate dehydrogenase electron transfer subunit
VTTLAATRWAQEVGRVARHRPQGGDHYWLDLDVPRRFRAPVPGQFVQLLLPADASAALLPRPMSVAGVRQVPGALRLSFLYAPIGVGTRALAARTPGTDVEVLGPLGRGFPLERPGTPVLVAGGRGVAPLLFAADALGRAGRRVALLFGARTAERLVGVEDARRRVTRLGGRLHACTDDGSRGQRGNVVRLLERVAPTLPQPIVIHACGPHAMLAAVARWAQAQGVEAWLAMESVMACGTGVCRGCPLPRSAAGRAAFREGETPSLLGNREFAMCCTEGPVFDARDLDWEHIE